MLMIRNLSRTKFPPGNKKPRKPAKNRTKTLPVVEVCDYCEAPLGRQCARTVGSAVCAMSEGIFTYLSGRRVRFFCSKGCLGLSSTKGECL